MNCYKCDSETIIDNNSLYFCINLRDFEAETEINWLNMFNKHDNKSTLKYRRDLTPNITFQADRIFVRNDLFEQIIKSCKATNTEFTMLGICPYEENYYEEEIIKIQNDIEKTYEEPTEVIGKVSNEKSTKKLTTDLIEESDEYLDESTTDWYDKNKFKKILTAIDSKGFNHKSKIDKLRFNNLVNDIKNITISEALAKQKLNALNEIKKAETKNKRLINGQKILLNLFDDLIEAIFNNNNKIVNEDNNKIVNEDNNDNDNDDNDNDDDITVKEISNNFKKIDETKSFEDQIDILKEIPWLNDYWDMFDYEDNKEMNLRLFKLKFAHIFNDVDDNLFKEIFSHTSVKLAELTNKYNMQKRKSDAY